MSPVRTHQPLWRGSCTTRGDHTHGPGRRCGTMDGMQSPQDVAAAVGRNVRALRSQHRMTVDALAAAAGVSRDTVVRIEMARGSPSIATLCGLAAALRVGVESLVDGDAQPQVVLRRNGDAPRLWSSPAGSSAIFRIGTDPPDAVELWDWTLQPGDSFDGEAHPMGTREVLSVLSGRLGLRIGRTAQQLGTGDVAGPQLLGGAADPQPEPPGQHREHLLGAHRVRLAVERVAGLQRPVPQLDDVGRVGADPEDRAAARRAAPQPRRLGVAAHHHPRLGVAVDQRRDADPQRRGQPAQRARCSGCRGRSRSGSPCRG